MPETKIGAHWRDDELDAIVTDYFAMLTDDLFRRPYVKSRHSEALMAQIGRTHRSVEFKHQNISAVLDELGMPWIPGYKPKRNYQNAIFAAIDRYLTKYPGLLDLVRPSLPVLSAPAEIFVPPPTLAALNERIPAPLRRLIRKFDPVERDHRNRSLGRAGEQFVMDLERRRLTEAHRADLARKVRWVAAEDGDGAGYDVLSFDRTGHERLLEVKTTNGSARTPFFLTRNELGLATERPEDWRIYRVHLFAKDPRIFTITLPVENELNLLPDTWRASFRRSLSS
jgi:Protein NO VEIN, C-terminal